MDQYQHYDADAGPQTEYLPRPELEYSFDPAKEYAALPPEFDQHTYARAGEEKERRRSLRRFLAVPAVALLAFLCWGPLSGAAESVLPKPAEPAPAQTEPAPSEQPEPQQTEEPAPPEIEATLSLDGGDTGSFTARLTPSAPDAWPQGLEATAFRLVMYNEAGEPVGSIEDWSSEALPEVTMDANGSVTASYAGYLPLEELADDAVSLSARAVLRDPATGDLFDVESNRVPVPEPAPETWPLRAGEEGKLVLTVYNDTTTFDVPSPVDVGDSFLTVLFVDAFPEEDFTDFDLPDPIVPDGYRFAGWVVQVGNPFDFGSDTDLFEQYQGDPPVSELVTEDVYAFPVGDVLTKADAERVPPGADGIRYVHVHATWIKEEVSDPRLFLDDGMGNVTAYDMIVPLASEGYLFLCNYPVPERPGYVFDGWYDENGNRVDLLVCYFSFTPMEYDSAGNFTGYNWNEKRSVTLTAHWKPE